MGDKPTNWFKVGCLGCLGVVGLFVVVLAALILIPLTMGPPEAEPVERELSHPLPPRPEAPPAPVLPVPPDPARLGTVELPPHAPVEGALRLELDLSVGSFRIEPGSPGEPLRVEADYDAGSFELTERFDEGSNTYRVRFGPRGGWFRLFHREVDDNAEVRVIIPRGQPVALEGKVGIGQSRMELGGLWLTRLNLELGAGEHRMEFSEPLSKPLPRFDLDASMGETEVRSLGNASPGEAVVHQGVGEMTLDLRGAWRNDARLEIDIGIGECQVRLPRDVAVDIERSSVGLGEVRIRGREELAEVPAGAPRLTLAVRGGIGELRID